jgi:hypothetical protein
MLVLMLVLCWIGAAGAGADGRVSHARILFGNPRNHTFTFLQGRRKTIRRNMKTIQSRINNELPGWSCKGYKKTSIYISAVEQTIYLTIGQLSPHTV